MKIYILILFIGFSISLHAQLGDEPFTYVENMPAFPGGMEAINLYVKNHLIYPKEARIKKIKGEVIVEFIVNRDGSTSKVKVKKGIGYGCDEEAIRVIESMNQASQWSPGTHVGHAQPVIIWLPVKFKYKK